MRLKLALVLLFCLLLSSCGGSEKIFVPDTTATAFLEGGAFSQELEPMDAQVSCILYGLDESLVTQSAVYGSLSAGAEELAVFVLTDEKSAEIALAALNKRLADQRTALKDYQPEEILKLDGAVVEQRGNTVLLVVPSNREKAREILKSL